MEEIKQYLKTQEELLSSLAQDARKRAELREKEVGYLKTLLQMVSDKMETDAVSADPIPVSCPEQELKVWEDKMNTKVCEVTENKEDIVKRLKLLLIATRAGRDISDLVLSENQDRVTIVFKSGFTKEVNIEADSGYAIITDVMAQL